MIVGGYFDATNSLFMQWSAQGALNFSTGSAIAADGNNLRWYLNTVTNQIVAVDKNNIILYLFSAGSATFANVGGVVDAYTATVPSITTLVNGSTFYGNLTVANNTGPATLNVSLTGAKAIVDQDGLPLTADDLKTDVTYIFVWNAPLNSWELAGVAPEQTDTLIGNVAVVDSVNGNDATAVVGSLWYTFKTIQAAVNAAVAGQEVLVFPGIYPETVTSAPNVPIQGSDRKAVRIDKIIVSTAGNHSISNMTIATVIGDAITISGGGAIVVDFFNVRGRCLVGADSVLNYTNTSGGTTVNFIDSLFDNLAAGGKIIKSPGTSGGGKIFLLNTFTGNLFPDGIAYAIDGAVNLETNGCLLIGKISFIGSGLVTIFGTALRTSTVEVIAHLGAGTVKLSNTSISTIASPFVIGTGIVEYAYVSSLSTGFGFAPTLNGGTGAVQVSYDTIVGTIPALSGAGVDIIPFPSIKAGDKIFLSFGAFAGVPSFVSAPTGAIVPGVSFTIFGSAAGNTSAINFMIVPLTKQA